MEKTSESRFLLLLLYILALHAIGILLFTRGFLLTRNELPFYSRCGDVLQLPPVDPGPSDRCHGSDAAPESSCHRSWIPSDAGPADCWTRPLVNKVVILVLDALRFDFAAPSTVFTDKPKPWMDKLQVLQQLAYKERSHALLFKFIADPPTTSLQRLKGLTTGSLPTFIDVGNSFGASAIVEDNIIHQLASNGKRIIMMGDDTWLQLFPTEFTQMYPFPSFNVKDLDTVDNGVVQHLFPALYEDSWDVLVGHFLGVDHAGHIFGVESPYMVDKLEKYNKVLEDVISVLKNQSFPGGLHEDTLLLVMGDHGQTLNGDHGGGTAEEIETALFAWNTQWSDHPALQICPCNVDLEKVNDPCICDFQQLDFAATLAVIMGVPIPFGSIGHINPQLLSLLGGSWLTRGIQSFEKEEDGWLKLKWMEGYYRLLRLNGWQVNRYFKQYAESVMSGFSKSDLQKLQVLFIQAQSAQPHFSNSLEPGEDLDQSMVMVTDAIEKYTKYLEVSASLARSKWTRFSDELMGLGLSILCIAVIIQVNAMYKFWVADSKAKFEDRDKIFPLQDMVKGSIVFGVSFGISAVLLSKIISFLFQASTSFSWNQLLFSILGGAIFGSAKSFIFYTKIIVEENDKKMPEIQVTLDPRGAVVILFYVMYGCSLLSNSFILKEHQVVTFFLGSSGFHNLRQALQRRSKLKQAMCFLAMNFLMGFFGSTTIFKDVENQMNNAVSSLSTSTAIGQAIIISSTVHLPMLVLGSYTVKKLWSSCFLRSSSSWVVFFGVPLSYISVMLHWLVGDLAKLQLLFISETTKEIARLQIPQLVYYIVALQTLLLVYEIKDREHKNRKVHLEKLLEDAAMLCLAVWGSLILLLVGRQGPLIILIAAIEGWCLMDMQLLCSPASEVPAADAVNIVADYSAANVQWSLFAIQIFFSTGHRCAFDGLRYAAAFVGFDKFNVYRQGILLAIDTFGASHVLPVAGLVLLVARRHPGRGIYISSDSFYRSQLFQALLTYGLVRMLTTVFATVCVTIQRRHLMVWGLFAPKFVFEAIGLLVTDVILVLFYTLCRPLLK